ncbi:MAG: hypothetical protein ACLQBA_07565 [Candidatus Binataceae bacterium]
MRFVERGLIKPLVSKVLPLREIALPQNLMENKTIAGKIAMAPPPPHNEQLNLSVRHRERIQPEPYRSCAQLA